MPKQNEKKSTHDPEQLLDRGITNRVIDCLRAYLSKESGKQVVFSPDARKEIRAMARTVAREQDDKFATIQTLFAHHKNWNADYVARKAEGKHFHILVPITKIAKPKTDKVAKAVKPAEARAKAVKTPKK